MTNYMIDSGVLKQWKKELGVKRIVDMIAESVQNDPFYVGERYKRILAEWFADIWNSFNIQSKVHLRGLHYRILSQKERPLTPITPGAKKEDIGRQYENTDEWWYTLNSGSKYARYLGLVDPEMIEDKRNPNPIIYHYERGEEYSLFVDRGDFEELNFPSFPSLPKYWHMGFESEQHYHLEIWCEKSTMNDILIPLCKRYKADLITAIGEMTISNCCKAVNERFYEINRPIRIFYISDFDPAGRNMPVAAARKFEYFIHKYHPDLDVKVFPIVLTVEQVKEFKLPRVPIKEKEKRKGVFEERYGEGAVELDALEALYPGRLEKIVEENFNLYYDHDLLSKQYKAEDNLNKDLYEIRDEIVDDHEEEIDALREEYNSLAKEFSEKFKNLKERKEKVWQAIRSELEERMPDMAEYPIPESEERMDAQEPLYSSKRHYLEQINFYKDYQKKSGTRFKIKEKEEEK